MFQFQIFQTTRLVLLCFFSFIGVSLVYAQESSPTKKSPPSVSKPSTPSSPKEREKKNEIKETKKNEDSKENVTVKHSPKNAPMVETLRGYLKYMNVKIDKQLSSENTFVTHYALEQSNNTIDLVVVYIPARHILGFYTYEFGSTEQAKDSITLYKLLLNLNDRLAIGSFFVDKDHDIGLKFAIRTEGGVSLEEFRSVYLGLASVVKQYRTQIAEQLKPRPAKIKTSQIDEGDQSKPVKGSSRNRAVQQKTDSKPVHQ